MSQQVHQAKQLVTCGSCGTSVARGTLTRERLCNGRDDTRTCAPKGGALQGVCAPSQQRGGECEKKNQRFFFDRENPRDLCLIEAPTHPPTPVQRIRPLSPRWPVPRRLVCRGFPVVGLPCLDIKALLPPSCKWKVVVCRLGGLVCSSLSHRSTTSSRRGHSSRDAGRRR
jgi:hypothetical protein